MAARSKKLHIVMFPWLAFGHMTPFVELSKFIAQKGHKVSFISTKRNIDRLPNVSSLVNFVKLTLPNVQHLPENAEATIDVSPTYDRYLKEAYDDLKPELTRFLETESPDCVIYDFASHWLPPMAANLGISCAFFCNFNAWFLAFIGPSSEGLMNYSIENTKPEDMTGPPGWVPFPTNVGYRLYEVNRIQGMAKHISSGVSDRYRTWLVIMGSDVVFIRHCLEFEPEWLYLLEKLHNKPVIPVGLMPLSLQDSEDNNLEAWVSIEDWLCRQKRGSVVYVALGSEVALSQVELTELALGLELSGLPFVWALRKPSDSTELDSFELPDGFLQRTKGRGLVWTSWRRGV